MSRRPCRRARRAVGIATALLATAVVAGCGGQASTSSQPPASATPGRSAPPPAVGTTTISFVTSPVRRGQVATFRVLAAPGANCSLRIAAPGGQNVDTGLGSARTDAEGVATWTWTVPAAQAPGDYVVSATCAPGTTSTTRFTVV